VKVKKGRNEDPFSSIFKRDLEVRALKVVTERLACACATGLGLQIAFWLLPEEKLLTYTSLPTGTGKNGTSPLRTPWSLPKSVTYEEGWHSVR